MMIKNELDRYITNNSVLERRIEQFKKSGIIKVSSNNSEEIRGHMMKSGHNLDFVNDNLKLGYYDWAIVGCYYASYHAAIALIMTKGHRSKNHLATLLLLIKYFYDKGLDRNDIETMTTLLDYHDLLFYVESKNKREDAAYTTRLNYDDSQVKEMRMKTALFISKSKEILKEKE